MRKDKDNGGVVSVEVLYSVQSYKYKWVFGYDINVWR